MSLPNILPFGDRSSLFALCLPCVEEDGAWSAYCWHRVFWTIAPLVVGGGELDMPHL